MKFSCTRQNKLTLLGLLAALLLALPCFAVSPAEQHQKILELTPAYPDKQLAEYVENLGQSLVKHSSMPNEQFVFTVIDEPDINAYTTGNGYIYIYRGLLAYMKNEAELASVLAHEIGHVTNDHLSRQKTGATSGQILAVLAGILSGSGEVIEAGNMLAASMIRGHGREMELEADQTAAEILSKAGYDPDAMIDMLSIMKSNEAYQKQKAKSKTRTRQTYHGIFSTHPRNDMRLRTVVSKAKKLSSERAKDSGASIYRAMTNGLVWGDNFEEKANKPERYFNPLLSISFEYPKGWQHQEENGGVRGFPASEEASLLMSNQARTLQSPKEFIRDTLGILNLAEATEIAPGRLKGYTGIAAATGKTPKMRIAVIYYKRNAYIFRGSVTKRQRKIC